MIPFLISLSKKNNWFDDASDERKIHTGLISRLGGIGIVLSLIVSTTITALGTCQWTHSSLKFSFGNDHNTLLLLAGFLLIFMIGILDDFANLQARIKLIGQIIASLLVIFAGVGIRYFSIPFSEITINLGYFGPVITLIWIVGISNAVNLIDGMDGLSSSISAIATSVYAIIFLLNGYYILSIICFTLMGSVIGYLFYNFPPARIFMGDSGSLSLGFLLAVLPLIASPLSGISLVMPVIMLAIPIGDVLAAIIRRKRKGLHFFIPDREHMHHKLLNMGLDERQILALINGIQIFSGFSIILFYSIESYLRYFPILAAGLLVLTMFIYLHYRHHHSNDNR